MVKKIHRELHDYENNIAVELANVHAKLDLNYTGTSAKHNVVQSILRLHKGLA